MTQLETENVTLQEELIARRRLGAIDRERIERLVAALQKYGRHIYPCDPCTCGLDDALRPYPEGE